MSIGGSGGGVDWHNVVEGPPGKRGDHVFKSKELGFKKVSSGPLVRSSYHAG